MIRNVLALALSLLLASPVLAQSVSGASDDCATATPISGYGMFLGDNVGANWNGIPICVPHSGADVWYDWTAPASEAVYATLCPGTPFDSKLAVFDGPGCVGSMVACNDDHETGVQDCSTVSFPAVAGNVYKIMISGSPGAAANYALSIDAATLSFCHPGQGGVLACPCGNPPASVGRGCDNHGSSTGGAQLSTLAAPVLFPDQFTLAVAGENATALTVFFTGTATNSPPGVIHAAGVRCVTGLKRLYTGAASGGSILRPGPSDPSVSARSAAVGAPISAGQTRYYFTVYRDPGAAGPCGVSSSTVNLTNAVAARWAP